MWEATIDGRKLTFHLAGINNQNFIMRDEETGSWWQQITGEAIYGPLKGRRLNYVSHDELNFALWRAEQPQGRVLRPDERLKANYESKDWETSIGKLRVTTSALVDNTLAQRALIIGLTINGADRAYPFATLQNQKVVSDTLGGKPIMILLNKDGKSVRAFERTLNDRALTFTISPSGNGDLIDQETGSSWNFAGKATAGPLVGGQLRQVELLEDFWFDWKTYHPKTTVFP